MGGPGSCPLLPPFNLKSTYLKHEPQSQTSMSSLPLRRVLASNRRPGRDPVLPAHAGPGPQGGLLCLQTRALVSAKPTGLIDTYWPC